MTEDRQRQNIVERFPALRNLAFGKSRRQVPVIQQPAATDCGAVCLAMVLGYYGKHIKLDEIRKIVGVDRGGVDALSIIKGAQHYGLRGRGIKIEDLKDLKYLSKGAILHWEFMHWVVFERLGRDGVHVIDPAVGRRFVPMEHMGRSFTGVALTFEPTDTFEPGGTGQKRVWKYLKQMVGKSGLFSRIVVMSLLIQFFALVVPFVTGILVDKVVPRGDYDLLLVLGLGAGILVTFHFLTSFLRAHVLLAFQTQLDTKMTLEFLEHLINLPYSFFQERSAGDLMMRLNSNTRIREILTSGALSGVLDGSLVTLYLILIFVTSFKIGLLVLGLGTLRVFVFLVARRRVRDLMSQTLSESAKSQNYQVQLLAGIETLKACGSEHRAVHHWSNLYVNVLNVHLTRGRLNAFLHSFGSALQLASPVVILAVGGIQVLEGELSLGTMLALNALAVGFLGPLSSLIETAFEFQTVGSYFDRINDVFDTPREQEAGEVTEADRLRGDVTLERVSFRYGPTEPLVVKDISYEIHKGEFVALVGPSGSGKSTLAKLLVGLYQPTSGRVLYDGNELAKLEMRSVRRQVGIVAQDPYIFGATIRENIAMADPTIPFVRIVQAAKLAHIHDEIVAMPLGYDTIVSDAGASISGGQRQRVALARALVQEPAILLLDEATSALDAINEKKIQEELAALRATRIVIAHRFSTVVDADKILVMDRGRIVEQGTHEALLEKGGKYKELVAAQMESDRAWQKG
ncbi:MAG: peptidase domain-containing ABC transporter [Pseudomonadota bacterium]